MPRFVSTVYPGGQPKRTQTIVLKLTQAERLVLQWITEQLQTNASSWLREQIRVQAPGILKTSVAHGGKAFDPLSSAQNALNEANKLIQAARERGEELGNFQV